MIQDLKRITKEFDLIRAHFLANRNSFPNSKYEATNNGCRFKISGNPGKCELMVFDEFKRHLFTIIQDAYSYHKRDRSIVYNDGSILLIGENPISHFRYPKIYFNKLLTKEKYFHHCIVNDMPSYEHTVLAIEMKYKLQRKYINYNINVPFIDVEKLKKFSLNVDEFKEKYKSDTPW